MVERFSAAQMKQLQDAISTAVRTEFANVGLRVDDGKQIDEVRKDMSFLRWMREAGNRIAQRLGWLIIAAIASGVIYVVKLGVEAYLAMHGRVGGP